jgi:hypothetical protein
LKHLTKQDRLTKWLTIDKPLPNTKTTVEVPGEVEIQEAVKENVEEIQEKGGPVEIEMTEEGGAEVSFDPKVAAQWKAVKIIMKILQNF